MGVIDDVKARLDIVDVVSQYVTLTKAGRNFKALCPFHTEKTPSLIVFPDSQRWRCFGACADGGDAFSFVMRVEQLDFGDTLKLLAQRAGVALPERRREGENEVLFQINEAAARYFSNLLSSSQGKGALAYLTTRGVNSEAISTFRLGLSPGGWENLKRHLLSGGFPEGRIAEAGLLHHGDDGATRDLFRGRLMFPIHDQQGRIAGFSGRALDDSQPKYFNSPRTPVFDKGGILYSLHLAAEDIQREGVGVIVEGYTDTISAHQHGFKNVVASMGTALTAQQVAQLRGLSSNFVLALDPDTAGQEATLRSLESSWRLLGEQAPSRQSRGGPTLRHREPITLRIASLPQGKDPDQVIRDDPQEWQRLVAEALPWMDYYLAALPSKFDLATSDGKAQALEMMQPVIAAMDNPFEQDRYRHKLAEALNVTVAVLEASMGRPRARGARRNQRSPGRAATLSPFEASTEDRLEEYTLALLLTRPELRDRAKGYPPEHFHRSENREVFTIWLKCSKIDGLREALDQTLQAHLDYLMERPLPPIDFKSAEKGIEDSLRRLEERHVKELKTQEEATPSEEEFPGLEEQVLARNDRLKELHKQAISQRMRSS